MSKPKERVTYEKEVRDAAAEKGYGLMSIHIDDPKLGKVLYQAPCSHIAAKFLLRFASWFSGRGMKSENPSWSSAD